MTFSMSSFINSIYIDDTAIYSCLNGKFDRFDTVKLTADLKNDLQFVVNWGRKCTANFNASKTKLFSFNPPRKTFLPFIGVADANLQ